VAAAGGPGGVGRAAGAGEGSAGAGMPAGPLKHPYGWHILYVRSLKDTGIMATKSRPKNGKTTKRVRLNAPGSKLAPAAKASSRQGKVRKEFWLDPTLLREAQEFLGASNEREAVEMALDLVAFRKELTEGARALRGLSLSRID
jgi:hypothetical protein